MISRRLVLAGGAATALLATAGCSVSDPRMRGFSTIPPVEPTPTPIPGLAGVEAALSTEAELQALMTQLAGRNLSPVVTATAQAAAAAHGAHLLALRAPDPVVRPTAEPTPGRGQTVRPAPSPSVQLPGGDRAAVVRAVTDKLGAAAGAYRNSAAAAMGSTALLWASMAAYASSTATIVGSDAPRPAAPAAANRPLEPWSDVEAAQQVVRQLHALVYGYQSAYPAFRRPESGQIWDLLYRRRDQRDRLTAWLRGRGQSVPAAEPAYVLPVQPTDRNRAAELLATMELAYQPFAGAWVAAAADEGQRRQALDALEEACRLTLQFGGPAPTWPGWPA